MFLLNEETNLYWFHPQQSDPMLLHEYRLIGKLIGLAIYNAVILDLRFPKPIFKKMLGEPVGIEDLKEVDPSLARGLCYLLQDNDDDCVQEIYQRTFTVEDYSFGQTTTIELIPNGSTTWLTKYNRKEYVDCFVDYYLNKSVEPAMSALRAGFHEVCHDTAIKVDVMLAEFLIGTVS